jgi:hypothetical protein
VELLNRKVRLLIRCRAEVIQVMLFLVHTCRLPQHHHTVEVHQAGRPALGEEGPRRGIEST